MNNRILLNYIKQTAGGKGSKGTKLNIFMEETEPELKNGIWLQSNKSFNKVISTEKISSEPFWNIEKANTLKAIPYNFNHGYLTSINNVIYLISSADNDTTGKNLYKYDTLTDTYTQLTNIYQKPSSTGNTDNSGTCGIAVGSDIYMFGGSGKSSRAVKYDTLTDTYTDITAFPFSSYQSQICNINEDIYIFGSYYSNGINKAVKYNTLIDTYTSLTNIPYNFCYGAIAVVGTDIYLFGQQNGGTNCYKYDTLTDTYTKMSNIPYSFLNGSVVSVGTDIYLFGGSNQGQMLYKYDTLTDTYTKLENIPINVQSNGRTIKVNNDIYLFSQNKVQVLTFPQLNFDDNSIVIDESSSTYETEIITTDVENGLHYKFNDVFFNEENGFDNTIPTYYGNGTEWIKIKN